MLAVVPQPNENAWLLGLAALRQQQHVELVGARGFEPPGSTPKIVLPEWINTPLRGRCTRRAPR